LNEVIPHHDEWEKQGHISRDVWLKAGAMGLLGVNSPEEYGGLGADILFAAVTWEEQMYALGSPSGPGFSLHSDIVMPYLVHLGTEEQKKKYLPAMCRGEQILAIAMTEPGAGSDLAGVRTSATKVDGGYVLNGSKIYITNGFMADVTVVVAKTSPDKGAHGMSLFLVETGTKGFTKGNPLRKMGLKAQDTCELFFEDMFLPDDCLLGEENKGFYYLMEELPQERLMLAVEAQSRGEMAFEQARGFVNERMAFGKPLFDKQVVRHKLADMKTALSVNRAFVDQCLELHSNKRLDAATASMAKLASTENSWKICDEAVQLHGGAGYMLEYPVTRALADARVGRIYGGANEIMKEVIARTCKI
jgi:long-chain-acyl-CoA dehydrogenase